MLILDLETSCTDQGLANIIGVFANIFNIVCIVVPIILMIALVVNLVKMMTNPDDKKQLNKIFISVIAAVVVFFIPTMINVVMNMMGEKYNFSSCYMLAHEHKISLNSPNYIDPYSGKEKTKFVTDSQYEKGDEKKDDISASTIAGGMSSEAAQKLINVARSQIGVPYHTMHYGPKGSGQEGFGCAMFVSYCYNQVFFGGVSGQSSNTSGFFGSTYEYWGNVTKDGYNPHNKKFVEVKGSEAQAGDVIAFLRGNDHYSSYSNCYHVGLYSGNGMFLDSSGSGTSGIGVTEHGIDVNRSDIHFLRYVGRS